MCDSDSAIPMQTSSLASTNVFSVYHTVMADSGIFAPREVKAAPRAGETPGTAASATDALIERDRILSSLVARMAKKDDLAARIRGVRGELIRDRQRAGINKWIARHAVLSSLSSGSLKSFPFSSGP